MTFLNRFQWFRRYKGGKWAKVSGLIFNTRWVQVPPSCVEPVDEKWDYFWCPVSTKYLTICRYLQFPEVNKAKHLLLPNLRGTWLPSFDIQSDFGIAMNWLGIRIRISADKDKTRRRNQKPE